MSERSFRTVFPEAGSWLRFGAGLLLALAGGLVALCLLALTGYYLINRLQGGPPWPFVVNLLPYGVAFGVLPLIAGILLMRDDSDEGRLLTNRRLRRGALGAVLLLIVVGLDARHGPSSLYSALATRPLQLAPAEHSSRTTISPLLEAGISPGTNVMWCGTFQMAWNETCTLTGGPLGFVNNHPMVAGLNRQEFKRDYLDVPSYVAMAGWVGDGIAAKIAAAVKEKFGGEFNPQHLPDTTLAPRPQDILAYACLWKKLKFPVEFERLDDGLKFQGATVSGFGMGEYNSAHNSMSKQVMILDYADENDFVIELKTDSAGDRLILAKVQPAATLGSTVAAAQKRVASGTPATASVGDELRVPYLSFDLERHYHELERARLIPASPRIAKDLELLSAVQSIRFQLDEKGVELKSEAHMALGCGNAATPVPTHRLIFDRPFLVMLQRKDAPMPYFALWVENAELFARK